MNLFHRFSWLLTATLILAAGCASFEGNIPIGMDKDEAVYISPKNADGVQDALILPVEFPSMKGLSISTYEFVISRDDGTEVFSTGDSAAPPRWYQKILRRRPAVALPDEIIWDGRDNQGSFVADGTYYLTASAKDAMGNSGSLGPLPVIVDDIAPAGEISLPYTVFSPNGDGNQDNLDIYFRNVSNESVWEGIILGEADSIVRSYSWNGSPGNLSWDGTDDNGLQVKDGEYGFRLFSTDLAGNSFSASAPTLQKDSALPPISVTLSGNLISPNGDGILDTVSITLEAENPARISRAGLTIIDQQGKTLATLPAPTSYPSTHTVTALASNGRRLPDGVYYLRFDARYLNGATPSVVSSALRVDTTAPYAVVSADIRLFSPDGDGRRDTLALYQSTDTAVSWTGTLRSQAGETLFSRSWGTRAASVDWDGRGNSGTTVPDGIYSYTLEGRDEAGNRTVRTLPGIRVDTRPTPVSLRLLDTGFSPNGDGMNETARFTPVVEIPEGIIAWNFEVIDQTQKAVYTLAGALFEELPRTIPWDGGGAPEGLYGGRLTVEYEKGNITVSESPEKVALDLSGPLLKAEITPQPFSPDGDGTADTLTIKISATDPAGIMRSEAVILDPAGNLFLKVPAAAFGPSGWLWDGKSASGELVQSASDYSLDIRATDRLGNESRGDQSFPVDILVIREGDRLRISISSIYFKPNTPDYMDVGPEIASRNLATLDRLAVILKKYSEYRILLEGHAVRVYWDQPTRWPAEEKDVLGPLSNERARAIKAALSSRGIRPERMSTSGYGGTRPVVPHGDLENRWKNRRVEFILIK